MNLWPLFFLASLAAGLAGKLDFMPTYNLLLGLAAMLRLPRRLNFIRQLLVVPAGVLLLQEELNFPFVSRLWATRVALMQFDANYWIELFTRTVDKWAMLIVVVFMICWVVLGRRLRWKAVALTALLLAPFMVTARTVPQSTLAAQQGLDAFLDEFFETELERKVRFTSPRPIDYDVYFLQICSLAWTDLDFAGVKREEFVRRFDVVFTEFNTAASYSGPAALRLLRSTCGQQPHADLYTPTTGECYLHNAFRDAGLRPMLLMNHDGKYDDMLVQIQTHGAWPGGFSRPAAPSVLRGFDGAEHRRDYDTLAGWFRGLGKEPVGLVYNSTTLHDGNRFADGSDRSSIEGYPRRLRLVLDDVDRFIAEVEATKRKAIIVFIPEHGAAMGKSATHIQGMRELPVPAITHVPVGIRLLGGSAVHQAPRIVDAQTSYLAMTTLVARLMEADPFSDKLDWTALLRDLPTSEWVAENGPVVSVMNADGAFVRDEDGNWARTP